MGPHQVARKMMMMLVVVLAQGGDKDNENDHLLCNYNGFSIILSIVHYQTVMDDSSS